MARLSYKRRKKLPAKDFAVAGRKYPIEDKAHARNALARVSQHGSAEQKAAVRKKVHAKSPAIAVSGDGKARTRKSKTKHHSRKISPRKG